MDRPFLPPKCRNPNETNRLLECYSLYMCKHDFLMTLMFEWRKADCMYRISYGVRYYFYFMLHGAQCSVQYSKQVQKCECCALLPASYVN